MAALFRKYCQLQLLGHNDDKNDDNDDDNNVLFIAENCNVFLTATTPSPVTLEVIELVPS